METASSTLDKDFNWEENTSGIVSVVKGVGKYVPEQKLTSEEIEVKAGFDKFGIRKGMIKLFTGVEERYYAADGQQPSDMAAAAGKKAIDEAGIKPEDIDIIIFCAITNDFLEPAIANLVQERLGAKNAQCFDVKNACNAFMNGLDIADSFIKTSKAKCVLVTSGEVISPLLKFNCDSKEEVERRSTSFSTGDGGGAFVLCAEKDQGRGIRKTAFKSFGELWNNNVNWGGGTMYPHEPDKFYFVGDTKNLVAKGLEAMPLLINETIGELGWTPNSISLLVGAQVAVYITKEMSKRFGIPLDKNVTILPEYGNTGAAGIPMATCEALENGKISSGDQIVFYGAGNGLSIGCICIQW